MNRRKFRLLTALVALACASSMARAEAWCELEPGWTVVTHGTMVDNVFVQAKLVGGPGWIWMSIASPIVGKANVAVALAAQASGKKLSIYLDAASATCANYASWSPTGSIRHIKMHD